MGVAAYNRGSRVIREQIEDEVKQRQPDGIAVDNTVMRQEEQLQQQQYEIERLRQELTEAKEMLAVREKELDLARLELVTLWNRIERIQDLQTHYRELMELHKAKHHILSQVIRLGMEPDRYHELRALAERG